MIVLDNVAKRYIKHWIFKQFSYKFEAGNCYAILGANGSGKSTLLRIIASMLTPTKGSIIYKIDSDTLANDEIYKYLSYCAPSLDIIEEMTLVEFLHFHFKFKKIIPAISIDNIIDMCQLEKAKHQYIRDFSSGMRQRVKLAQAFFSQSAILLLDEPCSNLDAAGIQLYQSWLLEWANHNNRICIIASNDEREYPNIPHIIDVNDYK